MKTTRIKSPREINLKLLMNGNDTIPSEVRTNLLIMEKYMYEILFFFPRTIMYLTSAYRNEAQNKKAGGSPTSLHMEGKAIDFVLAVVYEYGEEQLVPVEATRFILETLFGFDRNEIILYDSGRVHFSINDKKTRIDMRRKRNES